MRRFRIKKVEHRWLLIDNVNRRVYAFMCWCSAMHAIDDVLNPKITNRQLTRMLNCWN